MTPELTALTCAALLQLVQFCLMAIPVNLELGPRKTMGPRDDGPLSNQLSPKTARLARALDNHFQSLILFAIAVTVITVANQSNTLTQTAAWTYVIARILYVPAYYFGLAPWRSVVWAVGFFAIAAMLISAIS